MKLSRQYSWREMTGPFLVVWRAFTLWFCASRFSRLAELVIARGCRRAWSAAFSLPVAAFFEITLPASLLSRSCSRWAAFPRTPNHALSGPGVGMRGIILPSSSPGHRLLRLLLVALEGDPLGIPGIAARSSRRSSRTRGAGRRSTCFGKSRPTWSSTPTAFRRTASGWTASSSPSGLPAGSRSSCSQGGQLFPPGDDGATGIELSEGAIHGDKPGSTCTGLRISGGWISRSYRGFRRLTGNEPKGLTLPSSREGSGGRGRPEREASTGTISTGGSRWPFPALSFGLLAIPWA